MVFNNLFNQTIEYYIASLSRVYFNVLCVCVLCLLKVAARPCNVLYLFVLCGVYITVFYVYMCRFNL